MRIWKQLLACLAVVCCGVAVWLWMVPGSGAVLAKFGVPQSIIALVAPDAGEEKQAGGGHDGGGDRGDSRAPLVAVRPVQEGTVNDRLNAIGSGEAIRSVTVTPQVAGTISEIAIKSGDHVKQGQMLMRLDNLDVDRLRHIDDYTTSELFSDDERAAIAYAGAMTTDPHTITDEQVDDLRHRFGDDGVIELTYQIGVENMRARMYSALGITEQGFSSGDACRVPWATDPAQS